METSMNWKMAGMAGTALAVVSLTGFTASAGANKFTGNVSLAVGQTFQDDFGGVFDDSYTSISGDAKLNVAFSSNINLQLDFAGAGSFADDNFGASLDRDASFQGAAHLYYRNDKYAVGVFGGLGVSSGATFGPATDAEYYFAGVQGQYYWNNFTFGVDVGYFDSSADVFGGPDDLFYSDAWFTNAEVRWYASEKVTVTANVGYMSGEAFFGGADLDTWRWGAKVEYWPETKEPLSLWVAYDGRNTEADFGGGSVDKDTHTVKIGVTFHFGVDGTSQDNDRNGPAFNQMDYGDIVVGG
jgi:hypothetical protein